MCVLVIELKLFCFDELVVGMNGIEIVELCELIDGICYDGMIILFIEYDVKLVMGLCDWVVVFDYGVLIIEDVLVVV